MKYLKNDIPSNYKCSCCGLHGVKLWREYNTCAESITLKCAKCSLIEEDLSYHIDESGKGGRYNSDQIGYRVPAVPTEDEQTYWGYTSVPEDGCEWWKNLPTYSN